ncbi:glycosyltransferase (plasmid) [Phormidium sp. CLA17]|uniref:glycosyltransferase n=1 Tax=Leptolyngbya sp. Cla-17 TaxID=2803751 RepID=UPI0014920D73|nr:glycosyltransferase [Leptolyngbya sp. Cla-17]MBM0745331.1 glycosyltransferase [Leptolyngbya sp. Cla-17]
MVGSVVVSGAIIAAWFAKQGTINQIFQTLNQLQENPPMWIEAPMMVGQYLLFWTVALFLVVLVVMRLTPQPRTWSRNLVISILAILTLRYLLWRSLSTLNLSTPLNGVFSLGLFFLELLTLTGTIIQLTLLVKVRSSQDDPEGTRRPEADLLSMDVINGVFTPSVDILVPTYNEPPFILQRTIIGCQALEYSPKTIYLLDDTHRPEVQALAAELGCEYITRPDNLHAKAGNLNHALAYTSGELIVVFDADFVPTKNFLTRTVGFFQDQRVALVQTPQTFYNPDPIARNLGLEHILTPEEEVFYRQIQPIRDSAGGVVCSGTSFVMRRSTLVETGSFVTESLSEDFFTGIRLAAQGHRLVYLNEKLSAGLAAESMADQALQRVRWAQGTLQAFFVKSNPLTIPGLRPVQRLAYLEGLLHWFTSISRVGFLLIPLAYSFLGVIPLRATGADILYFFVPYYLVNLSVFSWLNYQSRSALLADVYSVVLCFPLALTVIKTMLNPFGKGFKVTPKGTSSDHFFFNWQLALPLIIVFIASAFSLWINLGINLAIGMWQPGMSPVMAEKMKGFDLGLLWSIYNLLILGTSLLVLIDVPRPNLHEWFDLHRTVRLHIGEQTFWGTTSAISEVGAQVILTQAGFPMVSQSLKGQATTTSIPVELEILENKLVLQGRATCTSIKDEQSTVRVMFEQVSLKQQRQLVEMLFCRPGQWKSRCSPGELRSLWLLCRIILRPRFVFDRNPDVSVVAVSKV